MRARRQRVWHPAGVQGLTCAVARRSPPQETLGDFRLPSGKPSGLPDPECSNSSAELQLAQPISAFALSGLNNGHAVCDKGGDMAITSAQRPDSSRTDGSGVVDSGTEEPVSETVTAGAGRVSWGLPATAWSRILVLFLALAAIKIALLAGLDLETVVVGNNGNVACGP